MKLAEAFVNPTDHQYISSVPDANLRNVMAESVTRYRRADSLNVGDAVPPLPLTRLADGATVRLADLVSAQPLLLLFGSYT